MFETLIPLLNDPHSVTIGTSLCSLLSEPESSLPELSPPSPLLSEPESSLPVSPVFSVPLLSLLSSPLVLSSLVLSELETNAPSSMNIFLKSLARKIKENNLFSHLVSYMIELLGHSMKGISDFINQTFMFRHTDLNLVDKYNDTLCLKLAKSDLRVLQINIV